MLNAVIGTNATDTEVEIINIDGKGFLKDIALRSDNNVMLKIEVDGVVFYYDEIGNLYHIIPALHYTSLDFVTKNPHLYNGNGYKTFSWYNINIPFKTNVKISYHKKTGVTTFLNFRTILLTYILEV